MLATTATAAAAGPSSLFASRFGERGKRAPLWSEGGEGAGEVKKKKGRNHRTAKRPLQGSAFVHWFCVIAQSAASRDALASPVGEHGARDVTERCGPGDEGFVAPCSVVVRPLSLFAFPAFPLIAAVSGRLCAGARVSSQGRKCACVSLYQMPWARPLQCDRV